MKQGMSRKDALRAVRLERGGLELAKEVVRSGSWESFVETCWQDLRLALRRLRMAPAFTIATVLTLALGIGATTAIFTLVHAVLLKSLPVAKPSELYRIGDNENCCVNGGLQDDWSIFSYDKYKTFRDGTPGFTELAAFQAGRSLMGIRRSGSNRPAESQQTQFVSGNYFSMF